MEKIKSGKDNVNLFWTGGWDSTFQLLKLLLVYRLPVTPYYIIDPERRSTGREIKVMKDIKVTILNKYPETKELLYPTKYFSMTDIAPDLEISNAFNAIKKEKHIGNQYNWLARFCKEQHISDVQVSLELHPTQDTRHFDVEPMLMESSVGEQTILHIDPKFKDTDEYTLFRYFSFPVIRTTKLQMSEFANEKGWKEIMGMTWFCHTPTHNNKPCGKCIPCRRAIEEGMGWRIPLDRRIVSYFYTRFTLPIKIFVVKKIKNK
ncbi:hypothetical protein MNBD_IGNAVI01-449 [hydrothermal vent metagenome]|uniref:7-cyano-7-deazaguanine synthase n=1 Tax=hydrothermal vent metagenome TaxID=652676 RepID=A0A3B1C4L2_9ZZZZ